VIVGRFGARSRVRPGEQVDVAVDTRQLHFFDVDTGLGVYA
jgi:multiple sugar transport system ATP-binding protein